MVFKATINFVASNMATKLLSELCVLPVAGNRKMLPEIERVQFSGNKVAQNIKGLTTLG